MSKRRKTPRSRKTSPPRRPAGREHLLQLAEADSSPRGLKRRFESALDRGHSIAIDAQAAGRFSAAQAQVLVAAALAAEDSGVLFRIVAASEPFLASFEDLGLGGWVRDCRGDPTASG